MRDFNYIRRHANTREAAEKILRITSEIVPEIGSAIDLGCGVGTWLLELKKLGATEVLGVDGGMIDEKDLLLPADSFRSSDLTAPLPTNRKYDLALSLEVAEHLPRDSARGFVQKLTSSADFVLFSAAFPGQGGRGHINEQWPNYWIKLFGDFDFIPLDVIRRKIYSDENIASWYRTNILLYVNRARVPDLKLVAGPDEYIPPELYLPHFPAPKIKSALHQFTNAIERRLLRRSN